MIALYNIALVGLGVLGLPIWGVWLLASPRLRRGFRERLTPLAAHTPTADVIWVHAASVGEGEAAAPLIRRLLDRGLAVVATTLTTTGRDHLRARLPGLPVRLAPLDLPWLARRSARNVRARVLVLIETEIWPNLIDAVSRSGGAVVIVGGRISDGSLPWYRRARPLIKTLLGRVDGVLARSPEDRERFVALGLPEDRSSVGGDLKLDGEEPPPASEELRAALGRGPWLLGASTHPGEEEALLDAWLALCHTAPDLRLLLAPRHPERSPQVVASVRRRGLPVGLRSAGAADAPVVVLDTLGELRSVFALVDLVFSGGTLAPVGGHNLLEPVRAGRVLVHGPHLQNQRSQARLLAPLGVLEPVANAPELATRLLELWQRADRHRPAEAARAVLASSRGASARSLGLVLDAWTRHARA